MPKLRRLTFVAVLLMTVAILPGCGAANIDVAASIKVGTITTGWFDAGVVNGKNKLVPSASFTIANRSDAALSAVQVFSVFRFPGDPEELGSSLVVLRGAEALGPSSTSKPITVRGYWGFSGEQPRGQMLAHKDFRDARIEIFAKYGAGAYVKIADVPVTRQLLTS